MQDTPILRASEVIISELLAGIPTARVKRGQKYPKDHETKERYFYLDLVTSFDIETSKEHYDTGPDCWRSWMYIWQWQFGDIATVIGRTWEEFTGIINQINEWLPDNTRMLCFIHNASFEFQFIAGIWHFEPEDIFATDVRDVLYFRMGRIEMRCSYRLSNYSLDEWSKENHVDHRKLVGNLDYNVVRYPWTELTDKELAYCVNDVICVVECVTAMLRSYGDNLYSLPYTATGYIRRRVRESMRMWSKSAIQSMMGDLTCYDRLLKTFRGGNTHANRWWVDRLLGDVYSADRSSSYPDVICHCKYPMTAFRNELPTWERFQKCLDMGRAIICLIRFHNIRLKNNEIGCPYIPYDLCAKRKNRPPKGVKEDNGRILSAVSLEIALTDIDFEIIQDMYDWDGEPEFEWIMSARYGYLPRPLIDVVISLYKDKTSLKGIPGREVVYSHSKAELNACYG